MRRIYMLAIAVLAAAPVAAQQRPAVDNSKAPVLQFESVPDPFTMPTAEVRMASEQLIAMGLLTRKEAFDE